MKPVRRSHQCWFKLFEQHAQSGLNMKAFCEPLKINPKYFSLRRQKLGYKTKSESTNKAFVQVLASAAQNHSITVKHTSGLSIEFSSLPPVEYLQSLTQSLR